MDIHHTAIVSPRARLGSGVVIGPYAIIHGGVTLNDDVHVRAHAVIGSPAEKHGQFTAAGYGVEVGEGTHISEFVTIHSGTEKKTKIGNNCYLLAHAHIGHDAQLQNKVTVGCGAIVGGHSIVGHGANLALGSILHQFSNIGQWAMVGMGGIVTKKTRIFPGSIYVGNPVRFLKENRVGLERAGISDEELAAARIAYLNDTPDWRRV
jgi:UDP-N-acetylglucosamine acyltransferase